MANPETTGGDELLTNSTEGKSEKEQNVAKLKLLKAEAEKLKGSQNAEDLSKLEDTVRRIWELKRKLGIVNLDGTQSARTQVAAVPDSRITEKVIVDLKKVLAETDENPGPNGENTSASNMPSRAPFSPDLLASANSAVRAMRVPPTPTIRNLGEEGKETDKK